MHKCKKHPCPKPASCKCRGVRDANVPVIWLIGGTGAGKNSVCMMLAEKYGFEVYNPASMLRAEIAAGSAKSDEYNEAMANGELVPDDDIIQMLEKSMMKVRKNAKGYAVSSFPKTAAQGQMFEKFISPIDLILHMRCPDELCISRTAKRAAEAGAEAHREDSETSAKVRLEMYKRTINGIIETFREKIKDIDAKKPLEDVFNDVIPIVEQTMATKLANTPEPTCD